MLIVELKTKKKFPGCEEIPDITKCLLHQLFYETLAINILRRTGCRQFDRTELRTVTVTGLFLAEVTRACF